MAEFTGERVIPGLVDDNLLNEHLARYRFALQFVEPGFLVLDAGCGSGYGSAALAQKSCVIAIDLAAEALRYARQNYPDPSLRFLQASCEALPFADRSFDLITAFEVIEHLGQWRELLAEAGRLLKPSGVFLVSTPNKAYYAESRAQAGPNPFHCHEFEYREFEAALRLTFPHVCLWTQNHAESIVFAPPFSTVGVVDTGTAGEPEHAHFFLAACSHSPLEWNQVFAYLPETANLLREREHHIRKLEGELLSKDEWLRGQIAEHGELQRQHEVTLQELKQSNIWSETLNREVRERRARIDELQLELSERLKWLETVERRAASEAEDRLDWIQSLETRIQSGSEEIDRLNDHRASLEADLAARDAWGRSLDAQFRQKAEEVQQLWREVQELRGVTEQLAQASRELDELRGERNLIAASKWLRLGRKLRFGPTVDAPPT